MNDGDGFVNYFIKLLVVALLTSIIFVIHALFGYYVADRNKHIAPVPIQEEVDIPKTPKSKLNIYGTYGDDGCTYFTKIGHFWQMRDCKHKQLLYWDDRQKIGRFGV